MGAFNADGSPNTGFKYGGGGGAPGPITVRGASSAPRIDWNAVAAQAVPEMQAASKRQASADWIKNNPISSTLVPQAGTFGHSGWGGVLSKVSNVATGLYHGIADPALRGGMALANLQNKGQLGESGKQFAADFVNTGLNFSGLGEAKAAVEGKHALTLGRSLLKGAAQGAGLNVVSGASNDWAANKSAKDIVSAIPMNAATGAVLGAGGAAGGAAAHSLTQYVGNKLANDVVTRALAKANNASDVTAILQKNSINPTSKMATAIANTTDKGQIKGILLNAAAGHDAANVVASKLATNGGNSKAVPQNADAIMNEAPGSVALHPNARNVFADLHPTAPGDTKGAPLERNFVSSIYHGLAGDTQQLAKGMTQKDLALIDQIESRTPMTSSQAAARVEKIAQGADHPQQFIDVVASMKQGKDTRYLSDTAGLGRDMGYTQNHLTHVYEHNGAPTTIPGENPVPGYAKNRVIATKEQAAQLAQLKDANGNLIYPHLKPANVNAVEAHTLSMNQAAAEHGDEAFRAAIQQAHPGAVVGDKANGLYSSIKLPNGTDISSIYNGRLMPHEAGFPYGIRTAEGNTLAVKDGNITRALKENPGSQLINAATGQNLHSDKISRLVRSVKNDPLGAYDKTNAAIKSTVLGGGLFHSATTAGSVAGQQIMHGITHPTDLAENIKVISGTLSSSAHDAHMAEYGSRGVTDFSKQVGTTLNDSNIDVSHARVPVISQLHDMVFKRQIPEAKMMIMDQSMNNKFPGMDFNHPTPEQITYGRQVASAVNNLGGINRAIEGLTPRTAKNLGRVLLAPDYTEGKFRTLGNALTAGGPKGNISRQMVVGKTVLFALPGLIALTAAGKIDWNNPSDIAKNIGNQILDPNVPLNTNGQPTKLNPGGAPQSLHLPTTFISEIGKIIKPMISPMSTYGGDPLSGVKSYATNRIAAPLAIGARLAQNKDFYGDPIYGNDKQRNPLSPGKTAMNILDQVSPIPIAQGVKQANGQQSLRDTILNTLGGRVAGDTSSPAALHGQGVNEYYNTINPVQKQKAAMVKQVNALATSGQQNKAARLAQQWNDSLQGKFDALRAKYPKYDPKQDSNFTALAISPKPNSINKRALDSQKVIKVLNQFQ